MNSIKSRENGRSFFYFILLALIISAGTFIFYNYFYSKNIPDNSLDISNFESDYPDYKIYYYSQLDDNGKKIYYSILNNIETLKEGNQSIPIDINASNGSDSFQNAWDAISLDKPEIFYIDTNNLILESRTFSNLLGQTSYHYALKPNDDSSTYLYKTWATKSDVDEAINQVDSISNQIVSNATGSRYNKIKYIHDYIVANTSYSNSDDNVANIYGTLINQKALCEGYSLTFKYLLDKLNIPNVVVYGSGLKNDGSTEEHSWNYVQMENGNWYAVDCTWDDPIIIGGGVLPTQYKYSFFLKGSSTFFKSHQEENYVSSDSVVKTSTYFTYPKISTTDY